MNSVLTAAVVTGACGHLSVEGCPCRDCERMKAYRASQRKYAKEKAEYEFRNTPAVEWCALNVSAQIRNVRITNNLNVCSCGCHGSDPHHKSQYKRTITLDVGDDMHGTVVMPYSTQPVRVYMAVRYSERIADGYWRVDKDSVVADVFTSTKPRTKKA